MMQKQTIYIHKTRDQIPNNDHNSQERRVVTFVNGERDIMKIIKELIKDKYRLS